MGLQVKGELVDLGCAGLGGAALGCKSAGLGFLLQVSAQVCAAWLYSGTQAEGQCLPWTCSSQITVEAQEGK